MEAVKNGDLPQASILFDRYHRRIFNFLARLAMDRMLAEDLTQNTFLRMIKYRNSFKTGNRFEGWIYQVARNVFSDHYQAIKTQRSHYLTVENIKMEVAEDDETSERETREALLHQSMAMLSDEQRELLILTRFQHLKYEAVADIMGTTVANIKVKVHRAIAQLRHHYFELEKN